MSVLIFLLTNRYLFIVCSSLTVLFCFHRRHCHCLKNVILNFIALPSKSRINFKLLLHIQETMSHNLSQQSMMMCFVMKVVIAVQNVLMPNFMLVFACRSDDYPYWKNVVGGRDFTLVLCVLSVLFKVVSKAIRI